METTLWKFNKTTGCWVYCRTCAEETAQEWLSVWQKSEPDGNFKLGRRKPRNNLFRRKPRNNP